MSGLELTRANPLLSHSLNTLQPLFFPGFTFSWVGLISHRLFMPKLLMMKDKEVSCGRRSCRGRALS